MDDLYLLAKWYLIRTALVVCTLKIVQAIMHLTIPWLDPYTPLILGMMFPLLFKKSYDFVRFLLTPHYDYDVRVSFRITNSSRDVYIWIGMYYMDRTVGYCIFRDFTDYMYLKQIVNKLKKNAVLRLKYHKLFESWVVEYEGETSIQKVLDIIATMKDWDIEYFALKMLFTDRAPDHIVDKAARLIKDERTRRVLADLIPRVSQEELATLISMMG